MRLIHCSEERHAEAILDIFNHAILNSTALYDYKPREPSSMQGRLLGFASYGPFRDRPANKYSVEHSVYVHHECRGMGLGKRLLGDLIELAIERDVHVMVGGIDLANQASIALHERLGFEPAGVIREAAYKFGRWLDLAFYQKILETPLQPVEG
ncbi:GNAT family N-acetyltransferase [Pseudomonas plecoglossicida]|uniref:GNAT family N-acetyltransferase n=1 Tax=Pseudomonas plecoglossicida TaxID=70775 RepID=UPI00159F4ACE|nr:GNAT family N-acetyltransferase [Pseudomonas plecoglossicida]QLB55794.1 N-acetyltransferase [Pseudomonas plecoglossicida]